MSKLLDAEIKDLPAIDTKFKHIMPEAVAAGAVTCSFLKCTRPPVVQLVENGVATALRLCRHHALNYRYDQSTGGLAPQGKCEAEPSGPMTLEQALASGLPKGEDLKAAQTK